MALPENIKQLAITDATWIIVNLDCLGMVTHFFIRWSAHSTSSISNTRPNHALNYPELGFDAPKSAQAKGRGLYYGWHRFIDGRNPRRLNFGFGSKVHFTLLCLKCMVWLDSHY